MLVRHRLVVVCAVLLVAAVFTVVKAADPYWVAPMTTVNNTFKAAYPTELFKVSRFGDSITYSSAFFRQLRNNYAFTNVTVDEQNALDWLHAALPAACWDWQNDPVSNAAAHGAQSGSTSAWPLASDVSPPTRNIDYWLATDKPMIAIIMWGTNDVADSTITVTSYTNNMRQVVQACKAFGTIPVLTTIPPRIGYETQTAAFAQAIRGLATEQQVPLIDYNQEILNRRPALWNMTLVPGPDATLVPPGDGIHPSAAVGTTINPDAWKLAYDFLGSTLSTWGYTLRNWMTLHSIWDVQNYVVKYVPPGGNVAIKIYETAATDVPGPQPIRVFPIPALAVADGWTGAELAYDNWGEGLAFSTVGYPPYDSNKSLPITKPKVVIHGLYQPAAGEPYTDTNANGSYDAGEPFTDLDGDGAYTPANKPISVDNAFIVLDNQQFYVTQEGSDGDSRARNQFPYHVPRLARSHAENYMAVLFEFPQPVKRFGVFLPASSNNWGNDPQYIVDDQNFVKQDKSVYLSVVDETNVPMQLYKSLKVANAATYCPFASFTYDGLHQIKKVSIIFDLRETTVKGVSFMDAYIIPGVLPPLTGDINNDGYVNVTDLQALVTAWASQKTPPSSNWNAAADINGDGFVNVGDLQLLVANWGQHR